MQLKEKEKNTMRPSLKFLSALSTRENGSGFQRYQSFSVVMRPCSGVSLCNSSFILFHLLHVLTGYWRVFKMQREKKPYHGMINPLLLEFMELKIKIVTWNKRIDILLRGIVLRDSYLTLWTRAFVIRRLIVLRHGSCLWVTGSKCI